MTRNILIQYRGARSQLEMAQKYNVTQQAWSGWEQGKFAPSVFIMKKIEMDSGIPMEQIFFDVFNKEKLLNDKQLA